jgi:hypothetical protein
MLPIATAAIGGTHAEAARSKANERRSEPNKTKVKLLKKQNKKEKTKITKKREWKLFTISLGLSHIHWE